MSEEYLDVFTRDGKYLGVKARSECYNGKNTKYYNKPAWIWVVNNNREILIQKRSHEKKTFPDKWDISCAGHVEAGEENRDGALRELEEELGIKANSQELKYAFEFIDDDLKEIAQVYVLKTDMDLNQMRLQTEEVSSVKWVNYDTLEKIMKSSEYRATSSSYKNKMLGFLKPREKDEKKLDDDAR